MGATYIGDLLEALRDEALAALDPTRTGHPAPSRVFVSHGAPAVDVCEDDGLLAVYVDVVPHLHPRQRGRGPGGCLVVPTMRAVVELWRCHPTMQHDGSPWGVGVYEDAALDLAADLWCLLVGLYTSWLGGALTPGQPCEQVEFGAASPLGPSGGAAGWKVPITYTLSDPAPAGLVS